MEKTQNTLDPGNTDLEIFKIIEHTDESLIETIWQKTDDTLKCIAPCRSIYLHGYTVPVAVIMDGVLKVKPFEMLD